MSDAENEGRPDRGSAEQPVDEPDAGSSPEKGELGGGRSPYRDWVEEVEEGGSDIGEAEGRNT